MKIILREMFRKADFYNPRFTVNEYVFLIVEYVGIWGCKLEGRAADDKNH